MNHSQGVSVFETPTQFATRISLPFENFSLLARALTHRSYLNENSDALEDNERLEFLGDAVLDFVVGAWLYHRFPEMAEGALTRLRASLVKTEQLADFAIEINLGAAIKLGKGEEDGGGRTRKAMLCASFEALVGALYLDQGIDAVKVFSIPFLEDAIDYIIHNNNDQDPKSLLQEWAQSQGFQIPVYKVVNEEGPDHSKTFTVQVLIDGKAYGQGIGKSKQKASKEAAKQAIQNLEIQ